MVDNGNLSTYSISALGIIYAVIIGLGAAGLIEIGVPEQYAGAVILIVTVIYNAYYPRNQKQADEGA